MAGHRILITGCSGGGKSTLLAALAARGCTVVEEPGRRIVAEELAGQGAALPWVDLAAFARRALAMARSDLDAVADRPEPVFFDRGLIDAAVALRHAAGIPIHTTLGHQRHYAQTVLFAPPWPELFQGDGARRHGFEDATQEATRLEAALTDLGYDLCPLPKASVSARVAFVLARQPSA